MGASGRSNGGRRRREPSIISINRYPNGSPTADKALVSRTGTEQQQAASMGRDGGSITFQIRKAIGLDHNPNGRPIAEGEQSRGGHSAWVGDGIRWSGKFRNGRSFPYPRPMDLKTHPVDGIFVPFK